MQFFAATAIELLLFVRLLFENVVAVNAVYAYTVHIYVYTLRYDIIQYTQHIYSARNNHSTETCYTFCTTRNR